MDNKNKFKAYNSVGKEPAHILNSQKTPREVLEQHSQHCQTS